ncbi:CbiX/SirB N-terminal domain-containing protein [Propionimicrobium sp. PCR01-08-3]|uniref:sirohydrochlorin chelatase n=1 Tax=Propionimicrobium sp. PCR01-08-3 TaxID=3052086 RepID=UPI00255C9E85|nr:CbiX/SirB N-terminal domain-containing protein [Propionimicrobium sp. PCR01-08-3]WIY81397.1 CbiX/SirB N-terminal domain-containing protein [Propionimicrobium sp. PCR01-08-3]
MSAPALILLAQGTTDSQVEQVYHTLRHELQSKRPTISVHLAFADSCPPTGPQVIGTLANRGVDEVVLVPLDLSRVCGPTDKMAAVLDSVRAHRPEVKSIMARPIGPAVELLNVLDVRLRNALSTVHATELDGLVLLTPSWGDTRGAGLIARRARQWAAHHRLPVLVAHADGSGPDVASAIASLRQVGRRNIAVGSMFISPTEAYRQQAELGLDSGALVISAPLGADSRLGELAMARYSFAAMELLDDEFATDSAEADESTGQDSVRQVM